MLSGLLNEQIKIKREQRTVNAFGELVGDGFVILAETRAKVEDMGGGRKESNNEIQYLYMKNFIVRSYVPVDDDDVVEFQNKDYRVLSVERRREHNDIKIKTELINN